MTTLSTWLAPLGVTPVKKQNQYDANIHSRYKLDHCMWNLHSTTHSRQTEPLPPPDAPPLPRRYVASDKCRMLSRSFRRISTFRMMLATSPWCSSYVSQNSCSASHDASRLHPPSSRGGVPHSVHSDGTWWWWSCTWCAWCACRSSSLEDPAGDTRSSRLQHARTHTHTHVHAHEYENTSTQEKMHTTKAHQY